MPTHLSNRAANAEVIVDYTKKKVSFNYPQKKLNENFSYFSHNFYRQIGYGFGIIMGIIIFENYKFNLTNDLGINLMMDFVFYIWFVIGMRVLFGYISIFIHKISPAARKAFPKTNVILHWLNMKKKKIDLRQKYGIRHYIDGNKLILFNYDIIYFWYRYIGYNKLLKIRTKSVEPKDKKGEHYNFIAIFDFKNKLKEGILEYTI